MINQIIAPKFSSSMKLMASDEKQLQSRTSKLVDAGSCERLRRTFPQVREKRTKTSEDQRMKKSDGTNM